MVYALPRTKPFRALMQLSLVSKQFHSLVIHVITTAEIRLKKVLVDQLRTSILKSMHSEMVMECSNHPLMDILNRAGVKAHPYYTIRWLLYGDLERVLMEEERKLFNSVFKFPVFTNDFWDASVERTRQRLTRVLKNDVNHPVYKKKAARDKIKQDLCARSKYIAMRLEKKVPLINLFTTSEFRADYMQVITQMIMEPFCGFCLRRFGLSGSDHNSRFFCFTCDGVVSGASSGPHSVNDISSPCTMMRVCRDCAEDNRAIRRMPGAWHCPLMIGNCQIRDHNLQSCGCPCHDHETLRAYNEYLSCRRTKFYNVDPYENKWSVYPPADDDDSSSESSGEIYLI